jgi:predicted transcriptional regulator
MPDSHRHHIIATEIEFHNNQIGKPSREFAVALSMNSR